MNKTTRWLHQQVVALQNRIQVLQDAFKTGKTRCADEDERVGVVFVLVGQSNTSRMVLGVYSDEGDATKALGFIEDLWAGVSVEPWKVQGAYAEEIPSEEFYLRYVAGQKVSFIDHRSGKVGIGVIISDDYDGLCPNKNIIYQVVPDGLQLTYENSLSLFGYEIKGIVQ